MKTLQLTVWCKKGNVIDTEYGIIDYEEWCERECKRIKGGAYIVNKKDQCCIKRKGVRHEAVDVVA